MAEAEHSLFADPNISPRMKDVLPNGTQAPFLTDEHIKKHKELLDADLEIGDNEKRNLLDHIEKDIVNWETGQAQSRPAAAGLPPEAFKNIGGMGTLPGMSPAPAPPATSGEISI